ncbi:MAG: hypothetical protein ACI4MY_00930 [Christensenellales bacterium]
MVYSLADMDLEEFWLGYCAVFGTGDMVVLDRRIVGRLDLDKERDAEIAARLALLSREKQLILLVPVRLSWQGENCNSVIAWDMGKVVGVADEISPIGKYDCGEGVAVLSTSKGRVAVIVENDLYYAQVAEALSRVEVRYAVFCSAKPCCNNAVGALRTLSVYLGCKCYGCMSDLSVEVEKGEVIDVEVGKLRPMSDLTTNSRPYRTPKPVELYLMDKKPT